MYGFVRGTSLKPPLTYSEILFTESKNEKAEQDLRVRGSGTTWHVSWKEVSSIFGFVATLKNYLILFSDF